MTSFTLATLRTRVAALGDYTNSSVFTPTLLTEYVNEGIGEYRDLIDETFEGYFDKVGTVATVAGTATVALPADFLKARAIDVLDSGEYRPLVKFAIAQTYRYTQRGTPDGYMQIASNLELFPTPDAVYTIRLRYMPVATPLVGDSDAIDVPNGWEGLIIHVALLKCDEREERPLGDRLAIIDRYRQRVRSAAKTRNVAGPTYLPFPGEGRSGGWWA